MIRFHLDRSRDVSGISGTGKVAQGVIFDDGTVAMRWMVGRYHTTSVYPSIKAVETIHGHGDSTKVIYDDPAPEDESC